MTIMRSYGLIRRFDLPDRSSWQIHRRGHPTRRVRGHRDDLDRVPFGLRNAVTTYSDQIRVRLSDSATLGQIRSDPASGEELGFQHTSFTLPPNRSLATEHRQIFVVSDDSDTGENKTDEERAQ